MSMGQLLVAGADEFTNMGAMDYVLAVVALLGGLGAFLFGFKVLSDNIEKLATNRLRGWFDKTGKNRFIGVGIGAGVTAIIQSSSATTVMVVGFVNAGLMSLFSATAIIMGANIGTTITAYFRSSPISRSLSLLPFSRASAFS